MFSREKSVLSDRRCGERTPSTDAIKKSFRGSETSAFGVGRGKEPARKGKIGCKLAGLGQGVFEKKRFSPEPEFQGAGGKGLQVDELKENTKEDF